MTLNTAATQLWITLAVNAALVLGAMYRVGVFMGRVEEQLRELQRRVAELERRRTGRDAEV